jgi:hypothetical protein
MIENADIEILISSDSDYEQIVIEMYYKDQYIGLLNQDNGINNIKIELIKQTVDLNILEQALFLAKQRL